MSGPDGGFLLRDGSRRSPEATWFSKEGWSEAERTLRGDERCPVFAPEFVIELRSPARSPRVLHEKMEEYLSNGVKLGWLIDPERRSVTIDRPGQAPEVLEAPSTVSGEGPVAGFVLELKRGFDPA